MNIFTHILTNPVIISLLAGGIIGNYSKLRFPFYIIETISLYLIFTIGFKGGACLGVAQACTPPLLQLTAIGIIVGFIQPFLHYVILKRTTKLDNTNAAIIATQYGSISIVTFAATITFLQEYSIPYDSFMSAIAGIMEIPALFSGLWIIKKEQDSNTSASTFYKSALHITKSVVTNRKIITIFIGFFIGMLTRSLQIAYTDNILKPFHLILILFMLDIGINISAQKNALKQLTLGLMLFGIYMPVVNGILGLLIARSISISAGSTLLFALLLASASYIAVPAVMRSQAPKAQEAIYLPLALCITLPFNLVIGIPLFYYLTNLLLP